MPPHHQDDRESDPYRNGTATRWWIVLTGSLLMLLGSLAGWAYSSLMHRIERLEDADADIRRVQALRGEDIATLRAQMIAITSQLGETMAQHHDIEKQLMEHRR